MPKVVSFRPRRDFTGEEETPVGLPPVASVQASAPAASAIDLAGKTKVWFTIGAGNTGKTMLIRYIEGISANNGGSAIYAAADPHNRSLANHIENVAQPDTNDAAATSRWLEALLRHAMDEKVSVVVDLGGGDTSLQKLLAMVPDLAKDMDAAGIAPVAVYTLGPRVDDLAALASFEASGFQPAATALIRNEGLVDITVDPVDAFERLMRHSAYKAAVARGAMELWMPRLDAAVAQEIEAKRITFGQARDGLPPKGRKVPPLGPFDRSRVRTWLDAMARELAPIMSWLP